MEDTLKSRLVDLFDGKTLPKIAKEIEENYHSLTNWVTGRTDFPPDKLAKIARITKGSLTWLLTGEGEKFITPNRQLNLDHTLRAVIREIVRDELALATGPVQEMGTIDDFDIESAVKKYDNAIPVLELWYAHDRLPLPDLRAMKFSQWDQLNIEQKVEEVKSIRRRMDRQRERRNAAAKKPKNS